MKFRFKRRQELDQTEMEFLENSLSATLRPVQPRPGFVTDLKARLISNALSIDDRPRVLRYGLYIFAGIFGGVLLIATSMRAVFTLLITLGVIKHFRSQAKGSVAAQPVQ